MANNYQPFNRSLLAMAALQALPLSLFAKTPHPTFSSYCVTTWDMAIWLATANLISTRLI